MRERNTSIDLLKFLSTLLITNSHMVSQYGDYSYLAFGGYEGDYLFFFCSGYTLFLKPMGGRKLFKSWYLKRFNRIYPSLFAIAILSCLLWGNNDNIIDVLVARKYWFISCIMIQYIIIYFIGSYYRNKIPLAIVLTSLLALLLFMFWDHNVSIWSGKYISRYILSFCAMLLGAYVADREDELKYEKLWLDACLLAVSYFCFIACAHFYHIGLVPFDYLRFLPLCSFVYYLYKVGMNPFIIKIYANKWLYPIVLFIGGLCLEIYLVQFYILNDTLNSIFPLNIIILFFLIIASAYIVRCVARFITYLFQDNPINITKIFSLYK